MDCGSKGSVLGGRMTTKTLIRVRGERVTSGSDSHFASGQGKNPFPYSGRGAVYATDLRCDRLQVAVEAARAMMVAARAHSYRVCPSRTRGQGNQDPSTQHPSSCPKPFCFSFWASFCFWASSQRRQLAASFCYVLHPPRRGNRCRRMPLVVLCSCAPLGWSAAGPGGAGAAGELEGVGDPPPIRLRLW